MIPLSCRSNLAGRYLKYPFCVIRTVLNLLAKGSLYITQKVLANPSSCMSGSCLLLLSTCRRCTTCAWCGWSVAGSRRLRRACSVPPPSLPTRTTFSGISPLCAASCAEKRRESDAHLNFPSCISVRGKPRRKVIKVSDTHLNLASCISSCVLPPSPPHEDYILRHLAIVRGKLRRKKAGK
jgi:hypothetical protein